MELPKPAATVGSHGAFLWNIKLPEGTQLFTAEQIAELFEMDRQFWCQFWPDDVSKKPPSPFQEFRAAYCRKVGGE